MKKNIKQHSWSGFSLCQFIPYRGQCSGYLRGSYSRRVYEVCSDYPHSPHPILTF